MKVTAVATLFFAALISTVAADAEAMPIDTVETLRGRAAEAARIEIEGELEARSAQTLIERAEDVAAGGLRCRVAKCPYLGGYCCTTRYCCKNRKKCCKKRACGC